jgi:23S rRNA (pseudouridine1915-N3)-methyltransferase
LKIIFIGIGKTKHKFLIEGIQRYIKLLTPTVQVEEKYLKEEPEDRPDAVDTESAAIVKNIPQGYHVVLLEIGGKRMSSELFSSYIMKLRDNSVPGIAFLIGGSNGVNSEVKKRADLSLSLSDMTTTHQMIRLFLAEQLYRAFSIMNNKKYHK